MKQSTLFNIQRFSTEDGPGIRTTLFFKGCPLDCDWCHNPEGIKKDAELIWYDMDCMKCGDCVAACQDKALTLTENEIVIDRKVCNGCGKCVETCDVGAMEIIGKNWSTDDLLAEVLKDKTFYETSKGGITLSGGEPVLHYDFLMELLPKVKNNNVHIALDTCGFYEKEKLLEICGFTDLVLFDLKILDDAKHKEYTRAGTERILNNAIAIAEKKVPMWIRTPVIPNKTESNNNIKDIARFIKENLPNVERYDLLAFSNLCQSKYERMGKPFALENENLLSRARMEECVEIAKSQGVECARWSGPTID